VIIVSLTLTCPTCNKDFFVERKEDAPFRPFCSKRCKLVDLGRWLDGTYSITEPMPGAQSSVEAVDRDHPLSDSDTNE